MKKFNLKKQASSKDFSINEKMIEENIEKMNLANDQQGVVGKNINLSLPIKEKDNTVPFNQQLEASRKNATEVSITESKMQDKIFYAGEKSVQVMPINVKTEELCSKKEEIFLKESNKDKKDTEFWDKYVGIQLEGNGQPTKVDNNIPSSASQLGNNPERFKEDNIKRMVMASLKDADAMLFHIYAKAEKEGRELKADEKQQIVDINSGKIRLFSQLIAPQRYSPSNEFLTDSFEGDVIIMPNRYGKWLVYEPGGGGEPIDEFDSEQEALLNYPEGQIQNV